MKQEGKSIRLFGYIFFSVIGFIIALLLFFLLIRLFFGLLSYIPLFNYLYVLFIISVPAALFTTVFLIFFRRTKWHPRKSIRVVSYLLFSILLVAWVVCFCLDMVTFFKEGRSDIEYYNSYDTLFLSVNVTAIFLAGVLQAFTTEKEPDWMDKYKMKDK